MHNKLPIVLAVVLTASMLLISSSVYASGVTSSATVLNAAPTVGVGLAPDDNGAPGVQVINENWQTQNETVTITATVTDMNGYDDLTGTVTAVITGPNTVNDSPVSLIFHDNTSITAVYTGVFNMSTHAEGDYTVKVTANDTGELTGTGSKNFTYLHTAEDVTPPTVTDPAADPDSIKANGAEESELSVNVTDASGIYAVTINLSPIGGNSAQLMNNTAGTDTYTTTTTAVVGTAPGMYGLPVTATDNSTNTNTSVSILLTVLPNEVVATYDFTTGAGSDKWAFRKQHFNKPPLDNDDPNEKFKLKEYVHIKYDDDTMLEHATASEGFYAIHRFDFDIAESKYAITKIDILWDGKGEHDWWLDDDGATLYIWNFTSGAYEQLNSSTDVYITLEGSINASIGDYIGPDGNIIFIAEQNTVQWKIPGLKWRSRLGTDYVKVDVTHIPQPEVIVLNVTPSKTEVNRSEDMTFAINVRNDGAPGYGYVGGEACYLDETYCNTEWKMTDYLNTGDTYTAHLNWTVPADAPLGQYSFLSKTWDACWGGCEGTPCYIDGCCDGMQDKHGADDIFEVVS